MSYCLQQVENAGVNLAISISLLFCQYALIPLNKTYLMLIQFLSELHNASIDSECLPC
ncbi:hypothetical protein Mpsy_3128 [Methanolobus psychrophilus R15]|nr:hypothetical protein Mpsy_3128 [Methanolobus psychrophilus R15]